MFKSKRTGCSFSDVILMAAILLVGGFHEYISCLLTVTMSIFLLARLGKNRKLQIKKDPLTLAVALLCLSYGLSCFWAIDPGMALIGFLKFLPLMLYLLCLWQEEESKALDMLPYFGGILAALSAVCMQIPVLEEYFSVSGRLAGVFQYPNTFALFLLVCQLLLLKKQVKKIWDYLTVAVLVAALLYTGSRTVFVLFLVSDAAMLYLTFRKKGRAVLLAVLAGAFLLGVLLLLGGNPVLRRLLNISLTESTFVGRILYFADALPLLLKYPFGMGYLGYYYIQNSIQTGVYSVAYIHNDLLQVFLDVGWIPAGVFLFMLVRWFFRKDIPGTEKVIVGTVCLHSLFDFNLQFIGMFLLLLRMVDGGEKTKMLELKSTALCKTAAALLAAAGLYMGMALALSHWGGNELADRMYPYNTRNTLSMLEEAKDLDRANELAEKILKQNTAHYGAYSIKAKISYAAGDFTSLIQYKKQVFEKNPFDHTEYEEYCQMLIYGIEIYSQMGDASSVEFCKQELRNTQRKLSSNARRLSKLGAMIADQPVTELSQPVQEYISTMKGGEG